MTRRAQSAHRIALAIGAGFAVLAVIAGGRYLRAHGGWDVRAGSNDLMTIMLLVLGSVLLLSFALLRPGVHPRGVWLTSLVWSVSLFAALLFTWHVIVVANRWNEPIGTPLASQAELDAYIAAHPESFATFPYRIPTGIYLQSFEFLSASNVELSGYVWQTYGPEIPASVQRGIVLPEALEEAYEAHEAWRVHTEGGEQIGWYFSGTFRQNFDYRFYPFDRQNIWLRMWSPEPVAGVLLVPDFDAYRTLAPAALPGVDTRFVFGGWDPVASEFTYDLIDYNTDFGLDYGFSSAPDPELYFNLTVERDFLGPMLEHLVLETAIAILLFLLVVLMADPSRDQRVGFTVFDLTIAAGGLLFAVILDHNSLRSTVESQHLIYLEYFPLILDVAIVLVVLSAVLRVRRWRLPLLGYSGDLVPVVAYWPALFGTLLVVTLLTFFY
ncbi:MAG: hypothetical protein U0031_23455 [Thermomicrobiales bacterium]